MTEVSDRIEAIDWDRISKKQIWVEFLSSIWSLPVIVGLWIWAGLQSNFWLYLLASAVSVAFVLDLILVPFRIARIGYKLREDDLVFRKGLWFLKITAVPYGRMQLVDITRGPAERRFNLATLKLVTAAASTQVSISGLEFEEAEDLRDKLIALAESRRTGL